MPPRGPEKFASIFKNVSKVSAILLIMVVMLPYRFVAAIPDENDTESSKIGPQGDNYGGGSPGLLHKDLGGQDVLLPLKPDVSGKHTIRGVGGKLGHESKDKSGMDESMKEFDNVSIFRCSFHHFITDTRVYPFQLLDSLTWLYHCRNSMMHQMPSTGVRCWRRAR